MGNKTFVHVIIATSMHRTDWLLKRSLPSVYAQKDVDSSKVSVLIVDDNEVGPDNISIEFQEIEAGVKFLRKNLNLDPHNFTTHLLANKRTRGNSGTGAWNTGIEYAFQNAPEGYVAILDDDDEYLPHHLNDCLGQVNQNPDLSAIFQRIVWKNEDGSYLTHPLLVNQLTPRHFFVGNPGVQGSNMFFKTKLLHEIQGFDEQFPNTTDRELMIRFLWYLENIAKSKTDEPALTVIETVGVVHHNHSFGKVNTNFVRKQVGLELFYKKFRAYFSEDDFQKSLERARNFFKFQYPSNTYE